ncbi:ATP-binding protein [Candidatus Methanoprimaticola sp. MG2]|uniref:ATP-binding protein n=1 Tax=Candidatus Methanoprimaticola sp. MG2 TaxID=3228838 RepID=UPI0039C6E83A
MTLTPFGYKPRYVDGMIERSLKTFGGVCITGPKGCGKTWAGLNSAKSQTSLLDPEDNFRNRRMAQIDSLFALKGDVPHLVDEWQEVPEIWDAARFVIDKIGKPGQFILTGSSTPNLTQTSHSGIGRIDRIRMRPMSLFESGDSIGKVRLHDLFSGMDIMEDCGSHALEDIIDLCIRGGWPAMIGKDQDSYARYSKIYFAMVCMEDAIRLDGTKRDMARMSSLFKSLARNESTTTPDSRLMNDMREYDDVSISDKTLRDYIDVLDRLNVTDPLPAFSTNLRSSLRVGKNPKRHFVDPSLAVAALNLTGEMLMEDLRTTGFMFESLCTRDLRIYAEANDGHASHYRDSRGREVDITIEMPDGRWGAFEVKLGSNQIDAAANNLLKFSKLMEEEENPPSVLCIVCGLVRDAYRRPDGVYVVPITALKA